MLFSHRKGFTLVEIMIVLAIIALLAVVLFPAVSVYLGKGRDVVRYTDLRRIETALRQYEIEKGYLKKTATYADSNAGGWDLSSQPLGAPTFLSYLKNEGYLQKIPFDPLNNAPGDIAFGTPDIGYAYFYYCYAVGGAYTYPQFVLGARMEKGSNNMILGGNDGKMYYVAKWNEGQNNKVTDCQ